MRTLFLEVKDREDGHSRLINVNRIIGIAEEDDGTAYIEVGYSDNAYDSEVKAIGIRTIDKYVDIYNTLFSMELI